MSAIAAPDLKPPALAADATARIRRTLRRVRDRFDGTAPVPVVLAVSGGVDSTVLLHHWRETGIAAVVAHVNHGLRGAAADRDARFVARLAEALGFPCVVERVRIDDGPGGSLEARARAARYAALAGIARTHGASTIVTAHHRDDQRETVFMRIQRNAGPDGLAGMREHAPCPADPRLALLRPLLTLPRRDLEAAAHGANLGFVEDETNGDPSLATRNRLRHLVLPALTRIDPAFPARLDRIAAVARDGTDRIRDHARRTLQGCTVRCDEPAGWIELDRRRLGESNRTLRAWVLREAIRALDPAAPPIPGRQALRDLDAALVAGRPRPAGWRVRRGLLAATDARTAVLARPDGWARWATTIEPVAVRVGAARTVSLGDGRTVSVSTSIRAGGPHAAAPAEGDTARRGDAEGDDVGRERLDAERVGDVVRIRAVEAGDRMRPLGRERPVRVVAYLKKRGVPAFQRRRALVATDERGRVVAVPGYAVEAGCRVVTGTETVVEIGVSGGR